MLAVGHHPFRSASAKEWPGVVARNGRRIVDVDSERDFFVAELPPLRGHCATGVATAERRSECVRVTRTRRGTWQVAGWWRGPSAEILGDWRGPLAGRSVWGRRRAAPRHGELLGRVNSRSEARQPGWARLVGRGFAVAIRPDSAGGMH